MDALAPILDWLGASLDPSRPHTITLAQAWHGRLMAAAWVICVPLGIVIARYLKVTPGQDWPHQVDNRFWWRSHLILQNSAGALALTAVLILLVAQNGPRFGNTHALLGWTVVLLCALQILSGLLRGTKGGPTAPAPDGSLHGDHFSMTRRRRIFEAFHKTLGYCLLIGAAIVAFSGLWLVNAPRWMAVGALAYWLVLGLFALAARSLSPQVTTYQAIWGPDRTLPGNQGATPRGKGRWVVPLFRRPTEF